MTLSEIVNEYLIDLDVIFGIYLDSKMGYKANFLSADQDYKKNPNQQVYLYWEKGALHNTDLKTYKTRNSTGDLNEIMIGNFCLIVVYQLWEDNFREKIAIVKRLKKEEIKIESFGELRKIRQAIVHNNFNSTSELKKLFNFFQGRKRVLVTNSEFEKIINTLRADLKQLLNDGTF